MDTNNRLRSIWNGLSSCGRNTEFVDNSDRQTFDRRLVNEGAEFYARGLTSLRTALLTGLEKGQFELDGPYLFKKRKGSRLPTFLYRGWAAIFDDSGRVRDIVNVDAVSCLNQLLAVFGKIEGGHTPESELQCISNFVKNEEEVRTWNRVLASYTNMLPDHLVRLPSPIDRYKYRFIKGGTDYMFTNMVSTESYAHRCGVSSEKPLIDGNYLDLFILEARRLVRRILSAEDPRDIRPKHGSGASACSTLVSERYGTPRYIKSIDAIWSYSEYFYLSPGHLSDEMPGRVEGVGIPTTHKWLDDLEEYTPCAKVLLVPKDARGPRLISCEPRETMWIQQGVLGKFVTCLEAHPLTKGLVNFTDQSINNYQAYRASITRDSATLDLKDASDRISMNLVRAIFPRNWVDALEACRSGATELPDGTVVELSKFAPMGSALCFPVMALTIWSLLTAAANMSQTERSVKASGALARANKAFAWDNPVYVYGDDIIVPSSFAECAMLVLESVGLTVNTNKSFVRSLFRESCGGEYYNGWEVTPVRLRMLPDDDVPSRMRVIAFHNNIVVKSNTQPQWLTQLIHEWYPHVPEKTCSTITHMVDDWMDCKVLPRLLMGGSPSNATQLQDRPDVYSGVLLTYSARNHHLPRRNRVRYNRTEFRYLAVVPKGVNYPKDRWSQVFRALVNPRDEQVFGWDALAKRVSYKYRWAVLH